MIITVDKQAPKDVIDQLAALPEMIKVKEVTL